MGGTVKFLWVLYGALTLVHLGTCVWDSSGKWRALTKILLMPMVLLCYLALAGEPRILVIGAILLGWGGDVLLLYSAQKGFFLAGISSFLAGHLCYAWALGLRGDFSKPLFTQGLAGALLLVGVAAYLSLLKYLRDMKLPGAIYLAVILLMVWTAILSWRENPGAAGNCILIGALLFFVSDYTLSSEMFRRPHSWGNVAVMSTYAAGQFLLTTGLAILS